jgi:hypothetical protein
LRAGSQVFSFLAAVYAALRFAPDPDESGDDFLVLILHFTFLSALSMVD